MAATERTALLNSEYCNTCNHIIDVPLESSEYLDLIDCFESSSSLSLEELLQYKDDPWWHNLRRAIICSFWIMIFLTILLACSLSYFQTNACAEKWSARETRENVLNIESKIAI